MLSRISILRPQMAPAGQNRILLSFDDGPSTQSNVTSELLDLFKEKRVTATFCVIGRNVDTRPELVRRMHQEGHELVIHSYHHRLTDLFSAATLQKEIDLSMGAIRNAIGDPAWRGRYFRPPYGIMTPALKPVLHANRLKLATLNFFINDTRKESASYRPVLDKTMRRLEKDRGGAIVFHEMRYVPNDLRFFDKGWLPAAVEDLIDWGHGRGMTFIGYDSLADQPNSSKLNGCTQIGSNL